jgi:hypothetical protein
MATNLTPIGEAREAFHSSHLHPSGCRGAHTQRGAETLTERSR